MSESYRDWHRLFGMSWTDLFSGFPVTVELEVDLSLKQQFLDVVIIRLNCEPLAVELPDGFDNLGPYNLITFKSYQESLDGHTVNELVGHYVNYRKQISPSLRDLLPEEQFRLYAVCIRFPQSLSQQGKLRQIREGIYEVDHATGVIRVVVVHELPKASQNALLLLFSAREELVRYGAQKYRPRSQETSRFLLSLYERYSEEGVPMPYTKEQFLHDLVVKLSKDEELIGYLLKDVPAEKRLEGIPTEKRLEGIPTEKRLEGIPTEKRLEGIPTEKRLEGISLEDLLRGLSPEMRKALFQRLQSGDNPGESS